MAPSRTAPSPGSTGWFPVARAADVGSAPRAVGAGGRPFVVVRLRPGAEVTALSARCPHRLVPLTTGTVVDGRLQCASHGWQFNAEGRCVDIPSLGAEGTPPPRADLSTPWAVEERDGWVWIAPERTLHHRPPRAVAGTSAEPVPALPEPAGPVLDNLDPALEHAWHPVALSDELRDGGWLAVRLLGRTRTLERRGGVLTVDPPAWGVRERHGVVQVAPQEPRGADLEVPGEDARSRSAWLPPVRTSAPAAPLLDVLLDAAHAPFAHGAGAREVAVAEVRVEHGGFSGVRDDGVDRCTVVLRPPFQLLVRRVAPDGATTTLLVLLTPEDADSTRVWTRVLLGGPQRPTRTAVATEAARQQTLLAEDLALLELSGSPGLPLTPRDELHVPADRLGVALRRALGDFVVAARTPLREESREEGDVAA
ncbi:Rieske 2Fe-2S domain-containing protein [Modestobacter sp. Leaf380]|uniref:Rieske 2Fe-2S domain-containing protein n=1 Tax=Modestobacter sp. Leaf380 TaxID=1736356 RepID=UPI0006F2DC27|nr:Rieske 2Fe-2S domain-containing protein [Modestobacter sp. Leaf380]KQS71862.1 (2Fe-2S)-binding protein [Modestobacter sp. Leaf380]